MGERLLCMQEVGSSSLPVSTGFSRREEGFAAKALLRRFRKKISGVTSVVVFRCDEIGF